MDAEALLRFTSARAAVWFDNVPSEVLVRLKSKHDFLQSAPGSKALSEETRYLASLMLTAESMGKAVEPLPHPGRDILDLLDEATLRDVGVVSSDYPGHASAAQQWHEYRERTGAKAREKKSFYRKHFGLRDDVADFERAAKAMAERGIRPQALRDVVETVERLALLSVAADEPYPQQERAAG